MMTAVIPDTVANRMWPDHPIRLTTVTAAPPQPSPRPVLSLPTEQPAFDNARYWVGALLTSVVASLAALIGLVAANGVVGVPVLFGDSMSAHGMTIYGLASAGLAMGAALLYFAMLKVAPRPALYYGWIVGLVTVLAVLVPFTAGAALASQVALAGINLVIGLVVLTLVPFAADSARVGSH